MSPPSNPPPTSQNRMVSNPPTTETPLEDLRRPAAQDAQLVAQWLARNNERSLGAEALAGSEWVRGRFSSAELARRAFPVQQMPPGVSTDPNLVDFVVGEDGENLVVPTRQAAEGLPVTLAPATTDRNGNMIPLGIDIATPGSGQVSVGVITALINESPQVVMSDLIVFTEEQMRVLQASTINAVSMGYSVATADGRGIALSPPANEGIRPMPGNTMSNTRSASSVVVMTEGNPALTPGSWWWTGAERVEVIDTDTINVVVRSTTGIVRVWLCSATLGWQRYAGADTTVSWNVYSHARTMAGGCDL